MAAVPVEGAATIGGIGTLLELRGIGDGRKGRRRVGYARPRVQMHRGLGGVRFTGLIIWLAGRAGKPIMVGP
jgi:hypothetical protein